ncbi:MAG: hypothetical protein IJZ68_07800 [Bacteroidaceae bacterium]|nr:hypothetical protein [Bacteroidaceae bacterium]
MSKRFLALILCIFVLIAMAGCSAGSAEPQTEHLNPDIPDGLLGFETVFACTETGLIGGHNTDDLYESRVRVYYLREKLSDVMYVWRTSGRMSSTNGYSFWSSGMTVMMDAATGGPMTYDAFLQYIRDAKIMCTKCNKEFDEPVSYCPDCGTAVSVAEGNVNGK